MKFSDGIDIKPGDFIRIDNIYEGRVVASIDTQEYLVGYAHWGGLGSGIVVDTDFGGLIHYNEGNREYFELISRP